jgi:tetratricopeptide (TPR) repeat protein
VREGDIAAWDSLNLRFFRRRDPQLERLGGGIGLISEAGRRDEAGVRRLLEEMAAYHAEAGYAAREIGRVFLDLPTAERTARIAIKADWPRPQQVAGRLAISELYVAQGRWRAARPEIAAAARLDPLRARLFLAAAATLSFLAVPEDELERVRQELLAWNAAAPTPDVGVSLTTALLPQTRLYFLGLLSSRMGRHAEALAYADEMAAYPAPPGATPALAELARTVRADVAWRQGRAADALELLDDVRGQVPLTLLPGGNVLRLTDHVFSQEHARFLRAEALAQVGRDDEALRWFGHSFTLLPGELIYRAPAEFRMAQIHERAGRSQEASRHRARYVLLWREAEPAVREAWERSAR